MQTLCSDDSKNVVSEGRKGSIDAPSLIAVLRVIDVDLKDLERRNEDVAVRALLRCKQLLLCAAD